MRLFLLAVLFLSVSALNAAQQPNILFLLTDDQDFLLNSLSYMPKVQKHLISEGTMLTNYFIATPLCAPSRASILRGQYAHNTQIIDLSAPGGGAGKFHKLGLDNSTMGVWLQDAGYATAFYGKYLNSYPCDSDYAATVPRGWSDWFALCDPHVYDYYNSSYSDNGKIVPYPQVYQTETLGARTVDFIQKSHKQNKPFFIHLSGVAPHQPATPAHKYSNLFPDVKAPRKPSYDQADVSTMPGYIRTLPHLTQDQIDDDDDLYRNRLRALQSVDDNVETIVNLLDSLGISDNTYIVYTADNGFHLGEHRLLKGKRQAFEEDIRVPFIVRGPGVPKNKNLTVIAQNIDIAPTLAAFAGANTPNFVDGKSLAKLLTSTSNSDKDLEAFRTVALLEHWGESSEGYANGPFPNNTWQAVRVLNETWNGLYTSWCTSDHEYYNIDVHPYQQQNTFENQKPNSLTLDGVLRTYFQCAGTTCHNVTTGGAGNFNPLEKCYHN